MPTQELEFSESVRKMLAYTGKDREFISDHGLHYADLDGVSGVSLQVRLTSYRALPLSCIEGMKLSIDGSEVDMNSVTLKLNHYKHKLVDLASSSSLWWFILDLATLFIPTPTPLKAGPHVVEGTLITVEPYVTAGRFSFYNSSKRTLVLQDRNSVEVSS